jgi:hypothetical protein
MRRGLALGMAVIALGAARCGGMADRATSTNGMQNGRITGTLRMIGGPAPGRRLLTHTRFRVNSPGNAVASPTTDAKGRFDLVLPAGRYRLTLRNGSELLPRHVGVTPGQTSRLHVTLSVK